MVGHWLYLKYLISNENFYKLKHCLIQIIETIQMWRKYSKKNHKGNALITKGLLWGGK